MHKITITIKISNNKINNNNDIIINIITIYKIIYIYILTFWNWNIDRREAALFRKLNCC